MDFKIDFIVILFILNLEPHLIFKVNGACTWPAEFVSTQWYDSSHGILTFGNESMQGWTFTPTTGTVVSSWDCLSISTYSSDGRMILITSQPFSLFLTNYYAYLCITVTKVTESSYRYYINHEIEGKINFERLFIYPASNLTGYGTICSESGASDGEYQMLIKDGNESAAKIDCPWHFLGRYGYTHTVSGGSTTCDQSSSEIDMCTDTQEMKFDYNACSTKVAYSVYDSLWCVDNIAEGDTNYVMVFNGNDADSLIDNQSVFRFTCMAVSGDASSASVSPRYCQNGQTPDQYPSTASGETTGALLMFSNSTETCPTCPSLTDPDQGSVSISTTGSVTSALYTCKANFTLLGTSTRTCQSDTTWTGAAPSCNSTDPGTGASTDSSELSISVAALVIAILGTLILIILAVLFGTFVYLYCRLRQERSSRVGSAVSREPEAPTVVEEIHPEVFTVPKPTGEKESIVRKYQNLESRPSSSVTASTVIFANGVTTPPEKKSPRGKVQLPPTGHPYTEKGRKNG